MEKFPAELVSLVKYLLVFIGVMFTVSSFAKALANRKPKTPAKCGTTDTPCQYAKKCVCRTCANNKTCGMPYTACQMYKTKE